MTDENLNLRRTLSLLLIFAAILAATRIPIFFQPIFNIDEADFAVQTAVWMNGGLPYVDFVEKKPPVIHAIYAIGYAIGGIWNMNAVHAVFLLITFITGAALMIAARRIYGKRAEIPALALFVAYQAAYDMNDFMAANTETVMNMFTALAILFLSAKKSAERNGRNFIAAGAMLAMATLCKHVAASFLPSALILIIALRPQLGSLKFISKRALSLMAGFAIPFIALSSYLASIGTLDDFIMWTWNENIHYAASGHESYYAMIAHGARRLSIFFALISPLCFLSAYRVRKLFSRSEAAPEDWMLASAIPLTLIAVSLGGRFFPHYFLQFIPPLTLLGAFGWADLASSERKLPKWSLVAAKLSVLVTIVGFLAFHFMEAASVPKKSRKERQIGAFIAKNTADTDKIFVWGHSSDVYFYSRRLPASRFSYCSYLTDESEMKEVRKTKYEKRELPWKLLMEDLEKSPPALIIDMSTTSIRGYDQFPISNSPELKALLETKYAPAKVVARARIWKRSPEMK